MPGMNAYVPHSERIRRAERSFLRRNRFRLPAVAALVFTAFALSAMAPWALGHDRAAMFILGFGVASALAAVREMTVTMGGAVTWRLGQLGEERTAKVLRALERNGWHVISGVSFRADNGSYYDVDHVAVGPGGILALETKLVTGRCDTRKRSASEAQALRNAEKIRRFLLSADLRLPVIAGVVWWVPGGRERPAYRVHSENVVSLNGDKADEWMAELAGAEHLDAPAVATAASALQDYVARRAAAPA